MNSLDTSANSSLRLWLHLMKCTKSVEAHMASQFRSHHNQSLARFDVLSQLYRFENAWTPIGEVADLMMASGGNITGLLDRMENEDLVIRRASPTDRRSYQVKMTAQGQKLFNKMTQDHEAWVGEMLAELPESDKEHLIELLVGVRRAFEPEINSEKETKINKKSAA
jgi:DNA-binding MarR family transcriptional regulator